MSDGGCSVLKWQERLTKVVERDRYLLKERKFTDVVFLVGEKAREFHCHRLYLAKTSPVFESMLYGEMASPLGEPISIPDATPDGFQTLLTYIYEGEVELKTFSAASGLLQLSKKYLLPQELQQQCRAQCWTLIYPRAVWQAIQFAIENHEDTILNTAWKVVCSHPAKCFSLEDFCEIPENMLLQVVQQQNVNCTELQLYQACVRWGQAEIVRRGLPENEQGQRTALTKILPHIRFLAMDNEALAMALTPPRFVTSDEALNLFILKNNQDETSKLTASTVLTGFNLLPEPRANEVFKTFKVEGCSPDLLFHSEAVESSFLIFTTSFYKNKQSHKEHSKGILLPSQVKTDAAEGETYEEEVTVNVFTDSNQARPVLLFSEKFKSVVPYNGVFVVPFSTMPCCHKNANIKIGTRVILHKSGTYPTTCRDGELKKYITTVAKLAVNNAFPNIREIVFDFFEETSFAVFILTKDAIETGNP